MKRIGTDRSRIECYQHCKRQRWLEYHEQGTGIQPIKKSLALCVGGSVHVGLAQLLQDGQTYVTSVGIADAFLPFRAGMWLDSEQNAVAEALTDFAQFQSALDIGTEAVLPPDVKTEAPVPSEYDEYLFREQSALVEAMVRAYARRRLRPLLEEFEVLEVEREGAWTLSSGRDHEETIDGTFTHHGDFELMFLSRPDALLRHRADNHLEILSYKTTGAWDVRKARDAEHDMQGLSEGIEVERRLGEWWRLYHEQKTFISDDGGVTWGPVEKFIAECSAPPRILAIRYEYLLKGERPSPEWSRASKELANRFNVPWARAQASHLIRRQECVSTPSRGANAGAFSIGDTCWSNAYHQEDGRTSKLAWQNWDSRLVIESGMTIREWIDKLDSATLTMAAADSTLGIEPREVGWSCDAQAVGYTTQHPLDAVFLPPMTVYRNEDDLRDLVEQMEAQEVGVAESVAAVDAAGDEDERRSLLNRNFPQTRRACEYPTTCAMVKVCYGGEDIRRDPLASGLFKIREVNHPRELEMRVAAK